MVRDLRVCARLTRPQTGHCRVSRGVNQLLLFPSDYVT